MLAHNAPAPAEMNPVPLVAAVSHVDVALHKLLLSLAQNPDLFARSEMVARRLLSTSAPAVIADAGVAPAEYADGYYWAAILHDLGWLAPSEPIQEHPLSGAAILRHAGAPDFVVQAAEFHHEWWDGTGYPHGLRGTRIPFIARAVAIADRYVALTVDDALTPGAAWREIRRNAETQFDPALVMRFLGRWG